MHFKPGGRDNRHQGLAWGVLGLYCYCRERRRNQWRAGWEDFVRRYAELDRALVRIWECR